MNIQNIHASLNQQIQQAAASNPILYKKLGELKDLIENLENRIENASSDEDAVNVITKPLEGSEDSLAQQICQKIDEISPLIDPKKLPHDVLKALEGLLGEEVLFGRQGSMSDFKFVALTQEALGEMHAFVAMAADPLNPHPPL